MKKFIPFLISGILAIGTFGCGEEAAKTNSEAPDATTEATEATQPAAQEASDKTTDPTAVDSATDPTAVDSATDPTAAGSAADLTAVDGDITTEASKALKEKLPKSNLEVLEEEGVVTVSGTVSNDAELNEIEPAVKSVKGVKDVKVDAKVEVTPEQ